jgi:hypothetical protein
MRRIFVIGCPRSGTTVVQAMLARHPEVFTLPETGFFMRLIGGMNYRWGDRDAKAPRRRLARRLGFARRYGRSQFRDLQHSLMPEGPIRVPWSEAACAERFLALLDQLAARQGCSTWLEKTPAHLLYLDEIKRYSPDARFVHVIRPGIDVLASLVDANLRYDAGSAFGGDLARWALRWNHAAEIHRAHMGLPQHHFVFLEDLTRDPDGQWAQLCRFLELPADAAIDAACRQVISHPELEPWKHTALSGQPRLAASKVNDVFGPRLREWLARKLVSYEALHAAGGNAPSPSVRHNRYAPA